MAIVRMQKLSIVANRKNRKAILEMLQSMQAMEIDEQSVQDPDLKTMDTQAARLQFLKNADSFDQALKLLKTYAPDEKKKMALFSEKEVVLRKEFDEVIEKQQQCMEHVKSLLQAEKELQECKGIIQKDINQREALRPWEKLTIPMDFEGTKKTAVLCGSVPGKFEEAFLYETAIQSLPKPEALSIEIISQENNLMNIAILCMRSQEQTVEENMRTIGFARPAQIIHEIPRQKMEEYQQDIVSMRQHMEDLKKMIASYASMREQFAIAADYYRMRAEKYRLLGTIPQSKNVFFITGWVPYDTAGRLKEVLSEKWGAVVEREDVREGELEPTLLHNNPFSATTEGILASYGLPMHGHVDPTFIMSFFYVIFFGMMLSDAGYGVVMAVACAVILHHHKRLDSGLKKMLQLFFWCGLSTVFWGAMYGGFFGNAIDTIATTFFGYTGEAIVKPLWFEPLNDPMKLLVWCMLFGLIHLFTGLGIKGYEALKQKDFVGFVSDIVSWYAFLLGLIFLLLPSDLFSSIAGMAFIFPAWVHPAAKWSAIIGALVILVMSGRTTKNWAIRIALGAYDLYGISGWLSDVLSYSRLLALGLATGVIANVVNMMASMVGGGAVGAVLFVIIFIFGHTLNIGINALGAYVHTNRLQYVEFFGKFYEGGGRAFAPFQTNNKYIEIEEEKK